MPGRKRKEKKDSKVARPDFEGHAKSKGQSRNSRQILEVITEWNPHMAKVLTERDVEEIDQAKPTIKDLEETLNYVNHALNYLNGKKFNKSIGDILKRENVLKLLTQPAWKSLQLFRSLEYLETDASCHLFSDEFFRHIEKKIYWRPFLDELSQYDEDSIISVLLFDDDLTEYIKKWDDSVVLAEEAIVKFGLEDLVKFASGSQLTVVVGDSDGFSTTITGKVYIPPFVDSFPDKKGNMRNYIVSSYHEIGHHRWKSFTVNMHADALDYDSLDAEFVEIEKGPNKAVVVRVHTVYKRDDEERVMAVEQEEEVKVRSYGDLLELVKYPALLQFIHNVLDDRRIDRSNMEYFTGIAEEYQEDIDFLLEKRPDVGDQKFRDILEGMLQYAIAGKMKNEVPEKLRPLFEEVKKIVDAMELGMETDGTTSMNAALKVYRLLEPELDKIAARVKLIDEIPEDYRPNQPMNGENENTPILVVKKPTKKKRGEPGIDPMGFLDLPIERESGQGEGGGSGNRSRRPGESKEDSQDDKESKQGKDGEDEDRLGEKPKGKEDEEEYHAYDEFTGEKYSKGTQLVKEKVVTDTAQVVVPDYLVKTVVSTFRRYAPKDGVMIRGVESGDIDPELAQDYLRNLEMGIVEEPLFHSDVIHERRSVATLVLLDVSGSMHGEKLDVTLQSGALIGQAAHVLNDPFLVLGVSGGEPADVFIMKDVEDQHIRIAPEGGGATPLAAGIRHSTAKILTIPNKKLRQMWVVTDADPNVGRSPVEDTKKAVEEGRAKGLKIFGIVIADPREKQQNEETFIKIFGAGNYLVTTFLDYIPRFLLSQYKRFVKL